MQTGLLQRLEVLTAALAAAAPEPTHRIKADYGPAGPPKKKGSGGGRKVASKAGEKRYGLPIGTPLGGTKSKAKGDAATQQSYDTFMGANTPADQRKAAAWMSTADLGRAAEALFSFSSDNERDESARRALVRELADRGIDPRSMGYRGPAVVLNPSPKQDPTVKAAETAQRKVEQATKQQETAARKVQREQETAVRKAESAQKTAQRDAERAQRESEAAQRRELDRQIAETEKVVREREGQALAQGLLEEQEIRAARARRQLVRAG